MVEAHRRRQFKLQKNMMPGGYDTTAAVQAAQLGDKHSYTSLHYTIPKHTRGQEHLKEVKGAMKGLLK